MSEARMSRTEAAAWATESLRRQAEGRAADRLRAAGWTCGEPNRLDREHWLMVWRAEQALGTSRKD